MMVRMVCLAPWARRAQLVLPALQVLLACRALPGLLGRPGRLDLRDPMGLTVSMA